MTIDLKKIQYEILEAERTIERNRIILQQHIQLEEMNKELSELRAKEAANASADSII
jgi:hypothetical protein